MKLCFLRQTALDMLRRDIPDNLDFYSRPDVWLDDYFVAKDISNYYFDSGIEVDDFQLMPGNSDTDAANSIALYDSLRGKLNRLQATDFRLWAYLSHTSCLDYMKTRWPLEDGARDS